MNNPYETPLADLGTEKQLLPKTKWKVFFWIVVVLEVLSFIFMLSDPEETLLNILLELVVYSFILIGLFGFSFNRKILKRKLWVYIIPISIAYDIYCISSMKFTFESSQEMYVVIAITIAIVLPLMFLQYLALFKYSFRSPEIWC